MASNGSWIRTPQRLWESRLSGSGCGSVVRLLDSSGTLGSGFGETPSRLQTTLGLLSFNTLRGWGDTFRQRGLEGSLQQQSIGVDRDSLGSFFQTFGLVFGAVRGLDASREIL